MRPLFRVFVIVLILLMFRSPINRLFQTSRHLLKVIPETISQSTPATMSQSEPTGLIAKKGLELLTFPTPNGVKISILLEELKATYGTQYTYQAVNIMKNTQKEPWFTALGPNGKIPVLVDHDKGGLAIMEGFAILNYLTRHYDPDHKFAFTSDPELSHCEQWMGEFPRALEMTTTY